MAATFRNTRDDVIRQAFEEIGVAIEGESLEAEYISVANRTLNTMVKAWQAYPIQLWKRETYELTLVASTASYTLDSGNVGEKPMRILECNRKDSSGTTTKMTRLSQNEYENLPNKNSEGVPTNYYFTPNITDATISFWVVPDTTSASEYTIEFVYHAPLDDLDTGTDNFDFPSEWEESIVLNLATRLSRKYGGLNALEKSDLKQAAKDALDLALSYDVEDGSIFFVPDLQGYR